MQNMQPSVNPEGDNTQALTEASIAPASITTTTTINTINPDQETETMNAITNTTEATTLVAGATFTGIVVSKNQHGATVSIDGQNTFLPKGDSDLSDLAKGSEVAVTVTDTEGSKPRVAIVSPVSIEAASEALSKEAFGNVVSTETWAGIAEEAAVSEPVVEASATVDQIDALAAAWGARRGTIRTNPQSSGNKKSTKPKAVAPQSVTPVVNATATETAPVVEAKAEASVVEAPAEVPASTETAAPVATDTPKLAYLKSVKVGDEVKASVKFKKDFGAFFVTAGGLGFGLLHVSEMPGSKPEQRKAFLDGLRYKQELTLRVVSVDLVEQRMGLSLVAGEKASFFDTLNVGTIIEGTVSGTKEIGAFINLGVTTGFVHVSEVDGKTREQRDARLAGFKKGEKLGLVVLDINREKKEVRLSERRMVIATLPVDAEVAGTFAGVRNNVVVVDLNFGGRGYLPKKGGKRYEHGETIVARVRSVNIADNSVELV